MKKETLLLKIMGKIVHQLITSNFITDFTKYDTDFIVKSQGAVRFIWQVRDTGTWLYPYNEPDWAKRLVERMDAYKSMGVSNLYYYYNRDKLVPVFEKDVRIIAAKHEELRTKYHQGNMSIKEVLIDVEFELSKMNDSINPHVKENIQIIKSRVEHLLTSGYHEDANYISSWDEAAKFFL